LTINEKALGVDHPELEVGLTGLGELLYETQKFARARPLLERAHKIREDKFDSYFMNDSFLQQKEGLRNTPPKVLASALIMAFLALLLS